MDQTPKRKEFSFVEAFLTFLWGLTTFVLFPESTFAFLEVLGVLADLDETESAPEAALRRRFVRPPAASLASLNISLKK